MASLAVHRVRVSLPVHGVRANPNPNPNPNPNTSPHRFKSRISYEVSTDNGVRQLADTDSGKQRLAREAELATMGFRAMVMVMVRVMVTVRVKGHGQGQG